jgi:hypothetical protein
MTALEFVSGIPLKCRPDIDDKADVVQALKTFYCRFLCEDGIEGSAFDSQVLDALDLILLHPDLWELKRDAQNSSSRDRIGTHGCG